MVQALNDHTPQVATHLATIHWFAVSPEPKNPPQPPSPTVTLHYGMRSLI